MGGQESSRGREFAWELVSGVWERVESLDKVIVRFSRHWKLKRIAKVELAILRLALFEMLFSKDTPPKVAINEAVELAKRFGDENSKNFVNGILDAAAKALEHGEITERS
ncbi:MAG: transcription antitermination factor NusB [Thermodesulfobacteriota bacterium]|nr:transcription antitermination factor NusB [Thermodesulfobacteriota bacterium]